MDYPLAPVTFDRVALGDGFWRGRLRVQKATTLPFALERTERAVENLRRCANHIRGCGGPAPFPHRFVSSDLYKVMEGTAYLLMLEPDPALETRMDEIIATIAEAQQDDGYLYVSHQCGVADPTEMGDTPYSYVVHSHELYNVGHMVEGAVAYFQATGKRQWLEVAERSAMHIHRVFFEGGDPAYNRGQPVNQAPGHQGIELALCRMYRLTGKRMYLDMARRFLDIRGVTFRPQGEGVNAPEYAQQHRPVREQEKAVGHAVRAAYMYAGMAEVGALTGCSEYSDALQRIWRNIVDTRMHITGGIGAVRGIEGFGPEYVLPNKNTYLETCAAIANVFFNYRMFLLHRDATYFDVAEVALLNNALAGVNLEGNRFFYVNPLETDGQRLFNHGTAGRAPWFDCACCPSNIGRILTQVGGYMYAQAEDTVYLLLYGSSEVEVQVPDGTVKLRQQSRYPFDGRVVLKVEADSPAEFSLKLRIPTWAREQFVPGSLYHYTSPAAEPWQLMVDGDDVTGEPEMGFIEIRRDWQGTHDVVLDLPMPLRFSTCDERVEANRQRVAVTRGPLVYCAEEIDNGGEVQRFFFPDLADVNCAVNVLGDGPLAGLTSLSVRAAAAGEGPDDLSLVPYFAWNNRGNASMIVWLPTDEELAREAMHAGAGS